jgi:hypothetical protein
MKKMRHMFFLCVRYLATCISSLGKRGWQHKWIVFLVVLLEYRATIFSMKTQYLAFIGCTSQSPCERRCFGNSDFLEGETQDLRSGDDNTCALFYS